MQLQCFVNALAPNPRFFFGYKITKFFGGEKPINLITLNEKIVIPKALSEHVTTW